MAPRELDVSGHEGIASRRGGAARRFDRYRHGIGILNRALYRRCGHPCVVWLEEPGGLRDVLAQDPSLVGFALRRGWEVLCYQHGPFVPKTYDLSTHPLGSARAL